ncbi:Hypothetical protein R9X50_00040600 [Acrodontium crateriforme]|uniref:non-specific serine/threonine protein kinase n=1 Tax=Acrodontium crateriforme TaxID=150365 RepID=A0AAQ3LX72_9PEZI|nr:Hypothetical protein R9X50_00040600 [Acrodontium crateriforme]
MAERYRHNRPGVKRQPLSEISGNANTPPTAKRQMKTKAVSISSHQLPHNESLEANGSLNIRSQPNSPENNRVSQIANEHERDTKRNSAISNTSTNESGRRRKTYIGHWQLGKTIGKGGCSRVRVVRHRYRDQWGAVKIITRSTAESTRAQSLANLIESTRGNTSFSVSGRKPIPYGLEREIAVMKLLEHPNIVRLYDVWENRNELYLIMEYVDGGELFHYVDKRKGLLEDETVLIFRQVVSALLYCHRLHICHRDLKPENILLDQRDLTVKLIDFGMAALQPEGKQLSTPCGSPHYAAPEVVSSKPYDGTQADVWSCGVILYVMLTGTTPYNYSSDGDIRVLFRDIARAKYWMPPDLSFEAKDLIKRIFVPDPKGRITMDEVWDHPLLHKYDKQLGFEGEEGTKAAAIGPIPTIEDWTVQRIQDIDREILRNMRTLWHSEPEQSLVQKLLNKDYNQEKLFYAALVKHREEHLENYIGDPDEMEYSASDYHHSHPTKPTNAPPLPPVPKSHSQYSIMNDEHFRPTPSFGEPTPSISSYDPYRASKDALPSARGDYVNVTVHRGGSTGTRYPSGGRNLRHPNALRVEMLKANKRSSVSSSTNLTRSGKSRGSVQRSSASHHSLTSSSGWVTSSHVISMRPSAVHKRAVNFGHMRRTSTASALTSRGTGRTPAASVMTESVNGSHNASPSFAETSPEATNSSPLAMATQGVRSRKQKSQLPSKPRIKVRKPDSVSHHMRSEIRKHSAELEKACEEAFFRGSGSSSMTSPTLLAERRSSYETPPSSVSVLGSRSKPPGSNSVVRSHPAIPQDTPNTYLTRTLEETRKKLAAYRPADEDNNSKFDEVMRMLEHIIPPPDASSKPENRIQSEHIGSLPMISEEGDSRNSKDEANWHRSITAPARYTQAGETTLRVVNSSSSGSVTLVAPLNVRKRDTSSDTTIGDARQLNGKTSIEKLHHKRSTDMIGNLAAIEENAHLPTELPGVRKKKSWFGLAKKQDSVIDDFTVSTNTQLLERRKMKRPSQLVLNEKALPEDPPLTDESSEFPIRKKRFGSAKIGFSKWLGRQTSGKKDEAIEGDCDDIIQPSGSFDSLFSSSSPTPASNDGPPSPGPERSWFARFFHIKPAVKVLCFNAPRGRARQELVILLREWQRHGVRDLEYSRQTNTISARIDKDNSLDIKPVTFRTELFVVLEHGRKVGLSIARFTQVKGAASGFHRALEVVDGVMRGRGWLIEDKEKVEALSQIVGG